MKFNPIIIVIIMLCIAMLVQVCVATPTSTRYAKVFQVVEIENDLIHLIDWNGSEWIYEGAEDWIIGDYAAAIMDTNGTPIIYDDIIVSLQYTRLP